MKVLQSIKTNITFLNLRHTCLTFENNELPMTYLSMSADRLKMPLLCIWWKYCIHHSILFRRSWHHHASIRCNSGRGIWITVVFKPVRPSLLSVIVLTSWTLFYISAVWMDFVFFFLRTERTFILGVTFMDILKNLRIWHFSFDSQYADVLS